MKIAIASDHAGFHLKEHVKQILDSWGVAYEDLGTRNTESVDYPDYARHTFTAQMSREHNDANVLILGGRILKDPQEVSAILKTWLETDFQGGRHQRRLSKVKEFEENQN